MEVRRFKLTHMALKRAVDAKGAFHVDHDAFPKDHFAILMIEISMLHV